MAKRAQKPSPKDAGGDTPADSASFESSLSELEALVDRLEAGDLPLEGALAAFERGVALTRNCADQLATAERRIEALVKEGENWVTRPFADGEGDD